MTKKILFKGEYFDEKGLLKFLSPGKSKRVMQYSLTGDLVAIHKDMRQASESTGIHYSSIWASCMGPSYYAFHSIWMFEGDLDLDPSHKKSIQNRLLKINGGDYKRILRKK